MNQMSVWLMLANEGMAKNDSFCAATPSAMVFGKSDGDRFAVTRDLALKPGYVLQFKVSATGLFPERGGAITPTFARMAPREQNFPYSSKEGAHLSKRLPSFRMVKLLYP